MNTSRLLEIVNLLIGQEANFGIQAHFRSLMQQLEVLSNNPQNVGTQASLSSVFENFSSAYRRSRSSFSPANATSIASIGGDFYFLKDLPDLMGKDIRDNAMTPHVVKERVEALVAGRSDYLQALDHLRAGLYATGVTATDLTPGHAEIAFGLPRTLFNDNLEGLIFELHAVKFIIRTFSEITTGSVEPVVVHEISTSDPLFSFGLNFVTISAIGQCVTWALAAWKKVEEIRLLREKTRSLNIANSEHMLQFFDSSIEQTIQSEISERIKLILAERDDARSHELAIQLRIAMESILARVERGMTVEIKFVPRPPSSNPEVDAALVHDNLIMQQTVDQLVFAPPSGQPILKLPAAFPTASEEQGQVTASSGTGDLASHL